MENKKGSNKQIQKIDLIKRYPFNGRSKYLIDKFSIIGFRPNQLHKILFQNEIRHYRKLHRFKGLAIIPAQIMVTDKIINPYIRSKCKEKLISSQHIIIRWVLYYIVIWSIWIFGSYGYGFDANDFIYGGFQDDIAYKEFF